MNPTLQTQFEAAKRSLVEDLAGLIRKAASEAVKSALSNGATLSQLKASSRPVRIRTNAEGDFEAMVGDRLVKRSRRRDLVRYARNKGFSAV